MSHPVAVTPAEFAALANACRPTLEKFARKHVGDYAEDVVQDAILRGFAHLHRFDGATGRPGAQRWLAAILSQIIGAEWEKRRKERQGLEEYYEFTRAGAQDAAWRAQLAGEARERIEETDLTELQAECLRAWTEREPASETARRLGISVNAVYQHKAAAVRKCHPAWPMSTANLPAALWRARNWPGGNNVTIYHAPQRVGAALANEKLRKMK